MTTQDVLEHTQNPRIAELQAIIKNHCDNEDKLQAEAWDKLKALIEPLVKHTTVEVHFGTYSCSIYLLVPDERKGFPSIEIKYPDYWFNQRFDKQIAFSPEFKFEIGAGGTHTQHSKYYEDKLAVGLYLMGELNNPDSEFFNTIINLLHIRIDNIKKIDPFTKERHDILQAELDNIIEKAQQEWTALFKAGNSFAVEKERYDKMEDYEIKIISVTAKRIRFEEKRMKAAYFEKNWIAPSDLGKWAIDNKLRLKQPVTN